MSNEDGYQNQEFGGLAREDEKDQIQYDPDALPEEKREKIIENGKRLEQLLNIQPRVGGQFSTSAEKIGLALATAQAKFPKIVTDELLQNMNAGHHLIFVANDPREKSTLAAVLVQQMKNRPIQPKRGYLQILEGKRTKDGAVDSALEAKIEKVKTEISEFEAKRKKILEILAELGYTEETAEQAVSTGNTYFS